MKWKRFGEAEAPLGRYGVLNREFWRGKRVFVTGHTGFKGAWLATLLLQLGATLKGYSLAPPTKPSLCTALDLSGKMENIEADIRNADLLVSEFRAFQPDIVFHLAAQPLVRFSYQYPRLTYETNVIGTLNVYEAVRSSPSVRVVVSVTTDKCYENKEWLWAYRENDPVGGYDPYSSSKACAELLSNAYRSSYFGNQQRESEMAVSLSTVRAGNVIGGGDWAQDRLLPDSVRALSGNRPVLIRNPQAVRPWQYVLDPLSGYLLLAERMWARPQEYAGAWNFGPNDDAVATVDDVVRTAISAWGSGVVHLVNDEGPHEAKLLRLDASKARYLLRWAPRLNLRKSIEETIAWYKVFYSEPETIGPFTDAQVCRFLSNSENA